MSKSAQTLGCSIDLTDPYTLELLNTALVGEASDEVLAEEDASCEGTVFARYCRILSESSVGDRMIGDSRTVPDCAIRRRRLKYQNAALIISAAPSKLPTILPIMILACASEEEADELPLLLAGTLAAAWDVEVRVVVSATVVGGREVLVGEGAAVDSVLFAFCFAAVSSKKSWAFTSK